MGSRREARELALQLLYLMEVSKTPLDQVADHFYSQISVDNQTRLFAEELANGVHAKKEQIDQLISSSSKNWSLGRMPLVDKNVIRMAIFELENFPDIPKRVSLNEAIEIAKKFGAEESGSFVNGVLDKIAKKIEKE